ncbi:hypothetical protein [Lysobacter sp. Root690]|uniref:hypothetical protein n=1 Tax=Lysobacter sp. Root690 TaxID=1736588 RepID=UPI00070177DB|nr:hypothetical protein [Lysobacter sp. Root690]KRB06600.1 hypothetical protein ASD86_11225 [Lysobacter sp. Root690]
MSRRIKYRGAGFRQAVSLHALRMLLLSLLMLVAHGAGADPVLADHELQTAKDSHTQLTALHAFAKSQLQAGQPSGAAFTFATEQAKSKLLAARLAKVEGQNIDSLQRGLYSDAVAQQQAIDHSVAARQLATALQGQFATLVVQPTSQTELAIADAAMVQLSNRLIQLEQAMIASQQ